MTFPKWLDRIDTLTSIFSQYLEWVGVAGLLVMFSVNFIDVVGAKLLLWPLPGATEMTGFSQIVAIAPAIAFVLILGRHIRVEFFITRLPARVQAFISSLTSFLGLLTFALILWQSLLYGRSLQKAGEIGSTSHIPFFPFAYLIAFCSFPVCLVFMVETLKSIWEAFKNGSR